MVVHAPPKAKKTRRGSPAKRAEATAPRHVAVIMDGNGRWAQERGLSRQAGHRAGTENIRRIFEAFAQRNVKYLTLFAFSTENWVRPRREVNGLLRLLGRVIDRELAALHENGIRLRHLGCLDPLSPDLQRRVQDAIELTKDNDRLTVCLAFNYGGRAEIIGAVKRIIDDGVPAAAIDEDLFSSYLDTAGIPDPDLIIRTGGEMRLSNLLPWQAIYAEFYSTPAYWPDFDEAEIDRAFDAYARRKRRFGGVEPSAQPTPARNGAHVRP
jgi:undecaprenyl diphosphate synthase